MSIIISADSVCGLSPAFLERYPARILPVHLELNGKAFRDGVDIDGIGVIDAVNQGAPVPKTSAPGAEEYRSFFLELLKAGDALIHFSVSREMSPCFRNAAAAAEGLPVTVIDSRSCSGGLSLLIAAAHRMKESGAAVETVAERMRGLAGKIDCSFMLDRIDCMQKGGLCPELSMLGANLLHIRPCVELRDGRMAIAEKYRGTYEKCLRRCAEDRLTEPESIDPGIAVIVHTGVTPHALEAIRAVLTERVPFREIYECAAGAAVTSHCGGNCLGVMMMRK